MSEFSYRAIDRRGRDIRGIVAADSRRGACEALAAQGLTAYSAEPAAGNRGKSDARPLAAIGFLAPARDPEGLARGLATMLGAGIALDRALALMAATERKHAQRRWIEGLLTEVLRGQTLSAALSRAGEGAPRHVVAVARAGEASGKLADVLAELAATMQRLREARDKVRSALIYPAIVVILACGVVAILFAVLFPGLAPLFEASGAPLPTPLRVSQAVVLFLQDWWLVLTTLLLLGGLLASRIAALPGFRAWRDGALLRVPALGPFLVGLELSRTARLLGLQLAHGVTLLEALRVTSEAARNTSLATMLVSVHSRLQEGASLSEALAGEPALPPIAHQLVAAGEAAGRMAAAFTDLARILDAEAQTRIDRMLTLLAPTLTIVVGGLIGLMVWSVMGAILSVNDMAVR